MKTKTERGVRAMKARMVIGAAARIISVILIVSIAAAAPCAAEMLSWVDFKAGYALEKGNQKYRHVVDNFFPYDIPSDAYVSLTQIGLEYQFSLVAPTTPIIATGRFRYTVEITEPGYILEDVLVGSDVIPNYGVVFTTLVEPDITLESVNGGSDSASIPGDRTSLTVLNDLQPNSGGLVSLTNKFTEGESQSGVPEPATIFASMIIAIILIINRKRWSLCARI